MSEVVKKWKVGRERWNAILKDSEGHYAQSFGDEGCIFGGLMQIRLTEQQVKALIEEDTNTKW